MSRQNRLFSLLLLFACSVCWAQNDVAAPESDNTIVRVEVSPGQVVLQPGETVVFSFTAYDAREQVVPAAFAWTFSGGTLRQKGADCVYTAGQAAGDYTLEAEISTGVKGYARITIRDTQSEDRTLAELSIVPAKVSLQPGQVCHFQVRACNRYGKRVPVPMRLRFSGGTMDNEGRYTAGTRPGNYMVKVVAGDKEAVAEVVIAGGEEPSASANANDDETRPGPLSRLTISPERVRLAKGQTCRFTFDATDKSGRKVPAQLSWTYQGGILKQDGSFTAGYGVGQYYLVLRDESGLAATAIVAILPDPPAQAETAWILLAPHHVRLRRGESCRFRCSITDDNGRELGFAKAQWSVHGGVFDAQSLVFQAGQETGDFYLGVQLSEHTHASAHITIEE